jgi:tRNA1Val (adenine37-N6)-methyltransferase
MSNKSRPSYKKYSQPEFYRFSQDSIFIANIGAEIYKKFGFKSILDIGAGSGVIGFELAQKVEEVKKLEFVELQKSFYPHLIKNRESRNKSARIFIGDFADYAQTSLSKFDLILCNPPYYERSKNRVSKNIERRICRFSSESFCVNSIILDAMPLLSEIGVLLIVYPLELMDPILKNNEIKLKKKIFARQAAVGILGISALDL